MRQKVSENLKTANFNPKYTGRRVARISKRGGDGLSEIETDFSAEIGNSNGFSAQKQVVSQKNSFHFWSKNRPQKHQKRAILHTFQANGGARAPPPGYATVYWL